MALFYIFANLSKCLALTEDKLNRSELLHLICSDTFFF